MSELEITKVISVRMPAIYFRRLGFLAYHQGKLPSEMAREILKGYLDMGCVICGGPVIDIDDEMPLAQCVNPECGPLAHDASTMTCNYSDYAQKSQLPGFSNRLSGPGEQDYGGPT